MINPIGLYGMGMSIRQIFYYQGEADSNENDEMSLNAYTCEFSQLIPGWRKCFNSTKIPFIFVQLPAHFGVQPYQDQDNGWQAGQWTTIQIAQNEVFKMTNYSGMVTTQDLGQNTLHYNHKTPVAERATLWSYYLTYGDKSINPEAPRFNYAYKLRLESVINFENNFLEKTAE